MNSPFCKSKRKEVNSDWLAYQWDEHSVFGACANSQRKMKEDDPEFATAHDPKILYGGLAFVEKI